METKTLDLYQYFGRDPQGAAGGQLTGWIPQTPPVLGVDRRRPAVLILPGGGYCHVSPREAEPVALRFLAAGWGAFVLSYSVAPSRYPTALREAAMAMAYLRQEAESLGIRQQVAVVGFSAGGHLAGCIGMLYDSPEVADIAPARILRPDALGLCYPVVVSWGRTHDGSFDCLTGQESALRQQLSLETRVRPDMPPVFLWHTRDDETVACRNSLLLAQALEQAGVDFALHLYRHGSHGLSTADSAAYPARQVPEVSWDVTGWIPACLAFFRELGLEIMDKEGAV